MVGANLSQKLVPRNKGNEDSGKPLFPPRQDLKPKTLHPVTKNEYPRPPPAQVKRQPSNEPEFMIINKFLNKDIKAHTNDELKTIHYDIINDMIAYEENFIADHRQYIQKSKDNIIREETELATKEDPTSSIESYLQSIDGVLSEELETTVALKNKLRRFKRYLTEEKAFEKLYVKEKKEPEFNKPNQNENNFSAKKDLYGDNFGDHVENGSDGDSFLLDG